MTSIPQPNFTGFYCSLEPWGPDAPDCNTADLPNDIIVTVKPVLYDEAVKISLRSDPRVADNTGKGYASSALDIVCALADKYHIHLYVIAKPLGKVGSGLGTKALRQWVERRGFAKMSNGYHRRIPGPFQPEKLTAYEAWRQALEEERWVI